MTYIERHHLKQKIDFNFGCVWCIHVYMFLYAHLYAQPHIWGPMSDVSLCCSSLSILRQDFSPNWSSLILPDSVKLVGFVTPGICVPVSATPVPGANHLTQLYTWLLIIQIQIPMLSNTLSSYFLPAPKVCFKCLIRSGHYDLLETIYQA